MSETKFKGVHFYWSQKKIENAEKFYSEYASDGSVIFDPFMGGGSSLYAIRERNLKFIGNDINELPIRIANFNCDKLSDSDINDLFDELVLLRQKLDFHYEYIVGEKKITFSKVIFSDLQKLEINLLSPNKNNPEFLSASEIKQFENFYKQRYISYSEKLHLLPNEELIVNSRIAIKTGMKMSDIFSPITFKILTEIKNCNLSEQFQFVLASCLHLCRLTDTKSQSQFPYWIPKKNVVERNIFDLLEKKIGQLKKQLAVTSIQKHKSFESLIKAKSGAFLLNKPTQKISNEEIPDNTVDLIFTDPPYFDQVAYSEYLKIWEFFVGAKSFLEDEIIVSQRKMNPSTLDDYTREITLAFKVLHNKLKRGGKMAIYFKDSRMDKVGVFLKILKECGFQMVDQIFVSVKKYTYKQNTSAKSTIKGDSVFIFSKGLNASINTYEVEPSRHVVIKDFAKRYLVNQKSAALGEIYNAGLVKELFDNNCIDSLSSSSEVIKNLNDICKYDEDTREYSLR